jgi:glycosyltransferase involved in cell wall biosynthesis
VTEIPTYPYDQEFVGFPLKTRLGLKIDQLFRNQLAKQMQAMVTFSDAEEIFGQKTIRISNGVDFDAIPLHSPLTFQSSPLHMIGVAEVHYWHGYDHLIAGLGEYYKQGGSRDVYFHIVGGVASSEMNDSSHAPGFDGLITKYGIRDHIIFHGQLFGHQLDAIFNQCQFAIGSLARHRSGIKVIKTLKNREYATRGIPFVYSEQDSDFDQQPYILKALADESPIDIQRIINFVDSFTMKPNEIRQTVKSLTWKIQMQRVVDACFINNTTLNL